LSHDLLIYFICIETARKLDLDLPFIEQITKAKKKLIQMNSSTQRNKNLVVVGNDKNQAIFNSFSKLINT